MKVVHQADKGKALDTVRRVDREERRALAAYIAAPEKEKPATPALLPLMHDKQLWLACDCLGETDPPLMHARKSKAGIYGLVRMPSRPQHQPGCPFAEGLTDHYSDTIETELLIALLRDLIKQSGMDHIWHPYPIEDPKQKPTLWTGLKLLRSAEDNVRIQGRSLKGYFTTYADGLPQLAVRLRQANKGRPNALQRGLMLFPVRAIRREGLIPLRTKSGADMVKVRGPIRILGDLEDQARSFLAAVLVSKGTDGRYEPVAAIATPHLSYGYPMPITNLDEVDMIKTVKKVVKDIDNPLGVRVEYSEGLGAPATLVVYAPGNLSGSIDVSVTDDKSELGIAANDHSCVMLLTRQAQGAKDDEARAAYLERFATILDQRIRERLLS